MLVLLDTCRQMAVACQTRGLWRVTHGGTVAQLLELKAAFLECPPCQFQPKSMQRVQNKGSTCAMRSHKKGCFHCHVLSLLPLPAIWIIPSIDDSLLEVDDLRLAFPFDFSFCLCWTNMTNNYSSSKFSPVWVSVPGTLRQNLGGRPPSGIVRTTQRMASNSTLWASVPQNLGLMFQLVKVFLSNGNLQILLDLNTFKGSGDVCIEQKWCNTKKGNPRWVIYVKLGILYPPIKIVAMRNSSFEVNNICLIPQRP